MGSTDLAKLVEVLQTDRLIVIVLNLLAALLPGFAYLYFLENQVFLSVDIVRLLLLAVMYSIPVYLMGYAVEIARVRTRLDHVPTPPFIISVMGPIWTFSVSSLVALWVTYSDQPAHYNVQQFVLHSMLWIGFGGIFSCWIFYVLSGISRRT